MADAPAAGEAAAGGDAAGLSASGAAGSASSTAEDDATSVAGAAGSDDPTVMSPSGACGAGPAGIVGGDDGGGAARIPASAPSAVRFCSAGRGKASDSAATVMENTVPATPIVEEATALSSARAPASPPA